METSCKYALSPLVQYLKDDAMAVRFMKTELWRLIDALARQFHVTVTDEMLAAAIRESNEIKKRL